MMAFTTKVKSPRVRKFIGSVKNRRIGRINMLRRPTSKLAHMALPKDLILNPGTM